MSRDSHIESPLNRRRLLAGLATAGAASVAAACSPASDTSNASTSTAAASGTPLGVEGRKLIHAAPGKKFDIDGNARRYRGTTFVFPVPQDSPFHRAQEAAQQLIKESPFRDHYAILPPSSMHMTLYNGVNDNHRGTPVWPGEVPADAPLTDVVAFLQRRLQGATVDVPREVTMRAVGVQGVLDAAPGLQLEPVDASLNDALRKVRYQIRDATGVDRGGIDDYTFHSALAYRLVEARPDERAALDTLERDMFALFRGDAATVTMEPPALNAFDDMLAYPQVTML